nr:immunoglobulin heavy chain junction region [Macaca mulatta]MOV36545.1 immunoglobulin heavy chain junction region [Macaca mulatta]MOV36575.1 immunoglobulin heavy chain junction region [Macaca mulatta]
CTRGRAAAGPWGWFFDIW